jgi:hypothetical protein
MAATFVEPVVGDDACSSKAPARRRRHLALSENFMSKARRIDDAARFFGCGGVDTIQEHLWVCIRERTEESSHMISGGFHAKCMKCANVKTAPILQREEDFEEEESPAIRDEYFKSHT